MAKASGRAKQVSHQEFCEVWIDAYKKDPSGGLAQVMTRTGLSKSSCAYRASVCRGKGVPLPYFSRRKTDWTQIAESVRNKLGGIEVKRRTRKTTTKKKKVAKKAVAKKTTRKKKE